jgi:hypothetical protein
VAICPVCPSAICPNFYHFPSFLQLCFLFSRALETENELLQDEMRRLATEAARNNQDLQQQVLSLTQTNKDQQNQLLLLEEEKRLLQEQLDRSEQEKLTVVRQLAAVEKQLETSRSQINKVTKGGGLRSYYFFVNFFKLFFCLFGTLKAQSVTPAINLYLREGRNRRGEDNCGGDLGCIKRQQTCG